MGDSRTIIITGSSGLVGSSLVSHFSNLGFRVRALQRSQPQSKIPLVEYYPFDLRNVQDNGFAGADFLVHCAYRPVISKHEREYGINWDIEGTKKVIALARKYKIKMIFLSTLVAHQNSQSYYAKNKLLAEGLFDLNKDLILKLGLVLGGKGGLFGRISTILKKYKIIPLIGGGKQNAHTVAVDDVCAVAESGLRSDIVGKFNIAHPAIVSMKELYRRIADCSGARPIFVPVPLSLAYRLAQLMEELGLSLPFSSQNVLGLKDFKTFDVMPEATIFRVNFKDYKTVLNQIKFSSHVV